MPSTVHPWNTAICTSIKLHINILWGRMTSLTILPLSCPLLPTVFNFGTSDIWSLFSGLVKKKSQAMGKRSWSKPGGNGVVELNDKYMHLRSLETISCEGCICQIDIISLNWVLNSTGHRYYDYSFPFKWETLAKSTCAHSPAASRGLKAHLCFIYYAVFTSDPRNEARVSWALLPVNRLRAVFSAVIEMADRHVV